MSNEKQINPTANFPSSKFCFFLVGFCCQLKKQPHSIEHEKMQIIWVGKKDQLKTISYPKVKTDQFAQSIENNNEEN